MIRSSSLTVRSLAITCIAAASVTACSSDATNGPLNDGDPSTPVDQGTVVPPDGGGAPVDNLDEDVNEGGIGNPQSDRDNNQPSQQDG